MKKSLVILLVGCTFAMGVIVGDRSWERLRIFAPVVIVSQVPSEVHHFRLAAVPPFSSDHYYFRDGFADVDEYWSFCLPLAEAQTFLTEYVQQNRLPQMTDMSGLPEWILGAKSPEWDDRYWFSGFDELDQVYYEKSLFCGYSVERERLYLMNWNE